MSSGTPSQRPIIEPSPDSGVESPPLDNTILPDERLSRRRNRYAGYMDDLPQPHSSEHTAQARSPRIHHKDEDHQSGISYPRTTPPDQINQKLNDLLQWFNSPDNTVEHQELAALHVHGTCSWFRDTDQYMKWKNGMSSFLWVQGKAGSGKSVLTYSIIENFKATKSLVLYFYCGSQDGKSGNAVQTMTSLLSQILHYFRNNSLRYFHGDSVGTQVRSFIDALFSQKSNNTFVDDRDLPASLALATEKLNQRLIVMIDALDKCQDVEKLLDALIECHKSGRMRVIVTSRPLQKIRDKLCVISPIYVITWKEFEEAVSTDISTFIEKELDTCGWFGTVDADSQKRAKKILSRKAEGMFLWAKHQVDAFTRCSNFIKACESLDKLPVPVQDLYNRIILDVDEQKPGLKMVRRVLAWLMSALRPIRLCEVIEALTIDLDRQTMEHERLCIDLKDLTSTNTLHPGTLEVEVGVTLLHLLGNLVTHNEETDHITFLHSSIKAYLADSSTNSHYRLDLRDTHEELAATCMCYLSLCLSGSLVSINKKPPFRIASSSGESTLPYCPGSPLLNYVLATSFNHLSFLHLENEAILGYMLALESDLQQHRDEWSYLCKFADHIFPWPSAKHSFIIYTLIAFAPAPLLGAFLRRKPLSEWLERYHGTNPLIYAAYFQTVDHARILLSRGANLQRKGWLVDDSTQAFPFVPAVQAEDESNEMVNIFLKWGIPVSSDLFVHLASSPLSITIPAIRKLLVNHAQACLSEGVYLTDGIGWTVEDPSQVLSCDDAVLGFSKFKSSEMVELFLDRDCSDPLMDFVFSSSSFTLPNTRRLLQTDEFVEWLAQRRSLGQQFSFHSFIPTTVVVDEQSLLTMVWRLIQLGLDPRIPDPSGRTIFHFASANGYLSIMEYLVEKGVPLPESILFFVLESDHWNDQTPEIIRCLVRHGADTSSHVSGVHDNGDTALHMAVKNAIHNSQFSSRSSTISPREIITTLVDVGCDPNARNDEGNTPLDLARIRNLLDVVQYLSGLTTTSDH